ncbi:hypothetical protein OIO90_000886 [Microbotryomycetes sp. JL221]|nr:hypothetical protein OIO90_000886 [Microbotryomycetes sp. JL221]
MPNSNLLLRRGSGRNVASIDTDVAQRTSPASRGLSAGAGAATHSVRSTSSASPTDSTATSSASGVSPLSATFVNIRRRSSVRPFVVETSAPSEHDSVSLGGLRLGDEPRPFWPLSATRQTTNQHRYSAEETDSPAASAGHSSTFSTSSRSSSITSPSSVDNSPQLDHEPSSVSKLASWGRKSTATPSKHPQSPQTGFQHSGTGEASDELLRAFALKSTDPVQARRVEQQSRRTLSDIRPTSKSQDPWLRMGTQHVRSASFQNTSPYTSPNLSGISKPGKHRGATRILTGTVATPSTRIVRLAFKVFAMSFVIFVVGRFVTSQVGSWSPQDESQLEHLSLPDTFKDFVVAHEGLDLLDVDKTSTEEATDLHDVSESHNTEGQVLHGEQLAQFRRDKLWGQPEDRIMTQIINPHTGYEHESTIIFLHGLTQHAYDNQLVEIIGSDFPSTRWVMPQAPDRPISVINNDERSGWFDMRKWPYDITTDQDTEGMFSSARLVNAVIEMEIDELVRSLRKRGGLSAEQRAASRQFAQSEAGQTLQFEIDKEGLEMFGTLEERIWAASKLVLAGFSQGSVMSLLSGLTSKYRLGGLVLISSFMPLRRTLPSLMSGLERQDLPMFWGHGNIDPYLLYKDALTSREILTTPTGQGGAGLTKLEFNTYENAPHVLTPDEATHINNFIKRVLA